MTWLQLALALISGALATRGGEATVATVGMPCTIRELVLPGSELEVARLGDKSPIVLRVESASPHGSAFRYDLEFYGLEAGDYDLGRWLRRKDGSATGDLPPIPVHVRSLLPPGQVRPHAPPPATTSGFGGYQSLLIAGGLVWLLGLGALVFVARHGPRTQTRAAGERAGTLADRLHPLVENAVRGTLSRSQRAELELALVAFWRRRLALEDRRPDEVLALLRRHEQAGPLLAGLENWLHRPQPVGQVDLAALLAPYRDMPADAMAELAGERKEA
jgi:hypothetical protein